MIDLDKLEERARSAKLSPRERWSLFDCSFVAAASPDVVLALIAEVRQLRYADEANSKRIEELADRRDVLLRLVANISQSTPLPDELAGWTDQRAALVAEVGTLKARGRELEAQRDEAQAQSNRDLKARRFVQAELRGWQEWMAPVLDAARAWQRTPACKARDATDATDSCAPGCIECDAIERLDVALDDQRRARIAEAK